jgi:DNA mismatch repair protein MutS2
MGTTNMDFSFGALEFERLKSLLSRYVSSEDARSAVSDIAPSTEITKLETEHELTAEAMSYLRTNRIPFREIEFLGAAIEKLQVAGTALEIPEIEAVQSFLVHIEGLRTRWKDETEAYPRLFQIAAGLPDLRELSRQLGRGIHNGEVDERYSPELGRIRRALESARRTLTSKLEAMLRNPDYSPQLQDHLVTVRNGRFVIPVRSEQRRGVDGIVHGTSSSGATVFMEPLAVLELNNDLVRLQEQEMREIARILAELSALIHSNLPHLSAARLISCQLEITVGKARFGREFDCTRPSFSNGGLLTLVKARHPLLEDNLRSVNQKISPVSLDLDRTRRILVISGPNAGGKTVVLKTVGLLAMMAQSGIPVPAEDATVPVFDQILADIGDQQSITNHLSTFSAHVLTIRSMIESATPKSLILMDEIGSSTEPGEGAALARAVLEQFRSMGVLAIATTHYNRLKIYAETTPEVANAAMEFNESTLEPTYRLLHGLAGASSGLKIAERLGMPESLLRDATGYLETGEVEAAHYIDELRRRIADFEAARAGLEAERREFDAWRQSELGQFQTQQKMDIARMERRLEEIAKEMSTRSVRELQSVQDESIRKKIQRRLDAVKSQASAQLREEKAKVYASPKAPVDSATPGVDVPVQTGATVRIRSLGMTGSVVTLGSSDAEVLIGNIRMRRPIEDLEMIEKVAKPGIRLPEGVHLTVSSKGIQSNEINLLGCKVDEALERVDKFLDEASLAQLSQVRIVHGTGTGALRNAIIEMLRDHPQVERFESPQQSEGGRGVTIAVLRD